MKYQNYIKIDKMVAIIECPITDVFVVEFGGDYQLQISKVEGKFCVTNGVNGWGNNCKDEFKDSEIVILEDVTQDFV